MSLSFNVRSVGRNKSKEEHTAGDRFLELFLHSLGVILTSVQDIEMKYVRTYVHTEVPRSEAYKSCYCWSLPM